MHDRWGPRGSRRSDSDKRVRSCSSRSGWRRVMLGALGGALCSILFLPQAAQAQSVVGVELEVGFDNRFAPGQWTPVSVVVESSQAVSGTLEVSHTQPDGSDSLYMLDIEVPGGGRKEFHLVIPGPPEQRRVNAQVVDGDDVLGSATVSPLELQESALVGVIGDAAELDPFTAEPSLTEMIPVPLTSGQLSLGAPALSSLAYVVASPDDLDGLVPGERDALADWVATGGRIFVVAEDPERVEWPGEAAEVGWNAGRVVEADVTLAGGRVGLMRAGIGEVMVGAGSMSALDRDVLETVLRPPPLIHSAGSQEFFNDFGPGTSADAELMNKMKGSGGSLRLSWFVAFLIAYLLLVGPVNYFVLKRRGRKELLWVTVPVLALVFSGVAYGLARGSRGDTEAATAGVVFATSTGQEGRAVAIVSSGTGGDRTFTFPTKAAVAPGFLPFFGSNQNGSTRLTPEGAEVTVQTAPFSMHFARGALDRFDGFIRAEVQPDGDDLRYRVVNETPHDLRDVTLVLGSVPTDIGDLAAGESATAATDPEVGGNRQRFRILVGGLRNALLSEARSLLGPSQFSAPLVVGFVDDYETGIALDGAGPGKAESFMVASPVQIGVKRSGGQVAATAGRVHVVSTDGYMTQYNPGSVSLEGFQDAVFSYQPPAGIDNDRITGGRVMFSSGGPRQDLERYDWAAERWVPIDGDPGRNIAADLPASAFSSAGEAYFRLRANRHGFTEIIRFEVEPVIG